MHYLLEHAGAWIVNWHSAMQVVFALLLTDLFHVVILGHPIHEDGGRVPVHVDHKVAGIIYRHPTGLVEKLTVSMNNDRPLHGRNHMKVNTLC